MFIVVFIYMFVFVFIFIFVLLKDTDCKGLRTLRRIQLAGLPTTTGTINFKATNILPALGLQHVLMMIMMMKIVMMPRLKC